MTKFQLKELALTLSLTAVISAHAAGLGTMTSSSKLGEPLNAEIELLAVSPDQLNTIQAALANDQVYQDQSLEKPASYAYINIDVANNAKGQPVLKISSTQPITEAFLDMLIQVDWPTGRLVKEYTILLDPPGFNSNSVSEPAGLPVTPESNNSVASAETPANKITNKEQAAGGSDMEASKKQSVKRPTQETDAERSPGISEGIETQRGDTLYAIARQMKPEGVSVEQMLVALYKNNPQAFDGKNMNRLKVGQIVRVPDQPVLSEIGKKEASLVVSKQHTAWLDYKNSLAGIVKQSAPEDKVQSQQQAAGKISSSTDNLAAKKPAKDVLRLSAGDEQSSSTSDKTQQAKQKENAAQEETVAKDNAVKEQQARAAALEKQVADMKKLMAVKDDAMTQAEQNSKQVKNQPKEPLTQKSVQAEAEKTDVQSQANKPIAAIDKKQQSSVKVNAAIPVEQQPSFIDTLIGQLKQRGPLFPLAVVALPLLLIIWLILRVKRKKQIDNFEDVIVTSPSTEMQNNTVFGQTQSASGDTSFLTDFSQSGVSGMIDSHDVDPIAEAEVYMAYGRDAQAEEILKDAIQKDPQRQELKLKLMEIYQNASNKVGFESVASEIYAQFGPNDPVWDKVVNMGMKVDPENPLYQTSASLASVDEPSAVNVAETEEAYHFNFEAPSLEIESANQRASDSETDQVGNASPLESNSVDLEMEQRTSGLLSSSADSTLLDSTHNDADVMDFTSNTAQETSDKHQSNKSNEEAMISSEADITAKPLDLPSLNLEDDLGVNQPSFSMPLEATGSSGMGLAEDDAVFESIPDLSLELGASKEQSQSMDDSSIAFSDVDLPDIAIDIPEVSIGTDAADFNVDTIPEMSLELGAPTQTSENSDQPGLEEESEEINTKLDLIQAYIDMEDMVGAKELIDEVIVEGGERQRQRANELLAKVTA